MNFIDSHENVNGCQVSHARRVYGVNGEVPDSYVKCYLRDGDKWLHKRKTRVVRRTTEPHFKQTLKYQVSVSNDDTYSSSIHKSIVLLIIRPTWGTFTL